MESNPSSSRARSTTTTTTRARKARTDSKYFSIDDEFFAKDANAIVFPSRDVASERTSGDVRRARRSNANAESGESENEDEDEGETTPVQGETYAHGGRNARAADARREGYHSTTSSPRGLVGGDELNARTQWSDSSVASDAAMAIDDLAHKSSDGKPLGTKRGTKGKGEGASESGSPGESKSSLDESGTLKIMDVDTGKEFIMRKSEASALLHAHKNERKIVKDAATGTKLSVDEFGAQAGLPSAAPRVHVVARGDKKLNDLRSIQTLSAHEGAVWTMKFNDKGTYLATAGQDRIVRVWTTLKPPKRRGDVLFESAPFRSYAGHRGDILDLCWSHTDWLLSSSMDKTVRLWYTTMSECLRIFTHQDFVTSIQFNPVNDKYFISGSLDGKLRMWNIPDLRVVDWVDIGEMVTSTAFAADGTRVVVGTHKGKCHFYGADNFKFEYSHMLMVKNERSSNPVGRKITGLEFKPGDVDKLLVTSNDSRIRLYDGQTMLACKYKGHANQNSQIRASFSSDSQFIISGSEQPEVFVWRTENVADSGGCFCSVNLSKQREFEKFFADEQHVTAAIFAPENVRASRASPLEELQGAKGQVIVTAGYTGKIQVFEQLK